jgi:hypothetical protein
MHFKKFEFVPARAKSGPVLDAGTEADTMTGVLSKQLKVSSVSIDADRRVFPHKVH